MEAPDRALIERARRGDADAFSALIGAYERIALAVAFGVLADAAAAADVTQDAFVRIWQRLGELREPARFGAWLCGIVRNLAIDSLRRKRPTEALDQCESSVSAERLGERWVSDPPEDAGRREWNARVAEAMAGLDETSRLVVTLRYYEDRPSKEIADLLEMTPAAVDMRLSRARKQLRELLQEDLAQETPGPTR
jgi:RNA polymerase sigma-70 factor, ECF subfamily